MRFPECRLTEFPFILPAPKRCRKWVFSPPEPGRALQVPTPPNVGLLNSIMSLMFINQPLGHPKFAFFRVQTDRISVYPPPLQTVPKMGFFTSWPQQGTSGTQPPNLGVLSSIMSLISINKTLEHPKMRFTRSRPTDAPFIHHPPAKLCRKWVFSPPEPGRAIQVPTPPNLGLPN